MRYFILVLLVGYQCFVQANERHVDPESTVPNESRNGQGSRVRVRSPTPVIEPRTIPTIRLGKGQSRIRGQSPVPIPEPRTRRPPKPATKNERKGHSPIPVIEPRTNRGDVRVRPEQHYTRTRIAPEPASLERAPKHEDPISRGVYPDRPATHQITPQARSESRHSGLVSPLIVNGTRVIDVNIKYPFMVHSNSCGASLVAPNVLLSAAHCQGLIREVFLGLTNVDQINSSSENYEMFTITKEVVHPKFVENNGTTDYDFMMLKMSGSSTKTPVVLDKGGVSLEQGKNVIAMGWGLLEDKGAHLSSSLMEVELDIVSPEKCSKDYSGIAAITDRTLCASRPGKDSCNGDSGGPLIDKDTQKQVGIVSFGTKCNDPLHPGVYARVQNQIDWIQKYIDEWSENDLLQ